MQQDTGEKGQSEKKLRRFPGNPELRGLADRKKLLLEDERQSKAKAEALIKAEMSTERGSGEWQRPSNPRVFQLCVSRRQVTLTIPTPPHP